MSAREVTLKNILILEDDTIVQRLYRRTLEKTHAIKLVGTVAEAIVALTESHPDVFLSDMRLPDGSGAEAVAFCQANRPTVPIIIVSGTLEDSEGIEVYKKFEKPFEADALINAIDTVTSNQNSRQEA